MLPCLLIPAIILANSEWLSITSTLTAVDFALDRVALRLTQIEQSDHAVIKATHQQHVSVNFDYDRVAARRLALNVLQGEQFVGALTLLCAKHLLRREDLCFAIHSVVGKHTSRRNEPFCVLAIGKLFK